jgi:hypothetical protein
MPNVATDFLESFLNSARDAQGAITVTAMALNAYGID